MRSSAIWPADAINGITATSYIEWREGDIGLAGLDLGAGSGHAWVVLRVRDGAPLLVVDAGREPGVQLASVIDEMSEAAEGHLCAVATGWDVGVPDTCTGRSPRDAIRERGLTTVAVRSSLSSRLEMISEAIWADRADEQITVHRSAHEMLNALRHYAGPPRKHVRRTPAARDATHLIDALGYAIQTAWLNALT